MVTTSNGRKINGTFALGNRGGPGRPKRATEAQYLAALGDAVSIDDWREVVNRALADAKAGDKAARQWLSAGLLGPEPVALSVILQKETEAAKRNERTIDVDSLDEEQVRILLKVETSADFQKTMRGMTIREIRILERIYLKDSARPAGAEGEMEGQYEA